MVNLFQSSRSSGPWCRCFAAGAVCGLLLSLSGCAMVPGSPNVAQVRLIDASPDAGGLDVYQGNSAMAYNLRQGTITSYVPLAPGDYAMHVTGAGNRTRIASAAGTFLTSGQYTVLVGNSLNALTETILRDQTTAAPAGQVSLRVLDQATRAGAVDLYLVPLGVTVALVKPVLTNVAFGTNTGYFSEPAGTYTIVAVPAGTAPATAGTSYTGAALQYLSGSARSIVLIDTPAAGTPGLQVILTSDYDPLAAA